MPLMDNLLNLFRLESQARGLRTRLHSAEKHLQSPVRQQEALQAQRHELEAHRRQLQAASANLDVEAKSMDERIEKLRSELNSSQNSKQYNAVLAEVNTLKTSRGAIDDRLLKEM